MTRLRRILIAVAVVIVALFAATTLLLNSAGGQRWLFARVGEAASAATGWQIVLDQPRLDGLGAIRAARITIADDDGIWLDVAALAIDWRPMALLGGRLNVDRIEVARIAVDRLPPTEAPPSDEPVEIAAPELPVDLRIGRIDIGELALAPEVAGVTMRLAARFELATAADRDLTATFDLHDLDRADTRVKGSATLTRDGNLGLAVDASDGPGGVLAGMSGQPGLPAVVARLAGSGPLNDWAADLSIDAGNIAGASGRVTADLAALSKVKANLTLQPGADFAALTGVDWPHDVTLAVDATQPAPQRVEIHKLTLTSAGSTVAAAGALSDGKRFDAFQVNATIKGADVAPLLTGTAQFDGARLQAVLNGPLATPTAKVTLDVDAPAVTDVGGFPKLACQVQTDGDATLHLSGDCRFPEAQGPDPLPAIVGANGVLAFRLTAPSSFDRLNIEALSFDSSTTALSATAELANLAADNGPTGDVNVELTRLSLGWLAQATGTPIDGRTAGKLALRVEPGLRATGRLDATASELTSSDPALATALTGPVTLAARFAYAPETPLRLSEFVATTPWARASGDGSIDPATGGITAALQAQIADVSKAPFVADLASRGAVNVQVQANGGADALTASGQVRVDGVAGQGIDIKTLTVDFDADHAPALTSASLRARGTVQGAPASLRAKAQLRDQTTLSVETLEANMAGVTLTGALNGDLTAQRFDGELALAAQSLRDALALAGQSGDGALSATVRLRPQSDGQQVVVAGDVNDLSMPGINLGHARIDATVADALVAPRIDARVDATGVAAEPVSIERGSVAAAGSLDALNVTAAAEGAIQAPFTVNAEGKLGLGEAVTVDLSRLDGAIADAAYRLQQPTRIVLADGSVQVADTALQLGDGTVQAQAELGPQAMNARATLTALPLEPIGRLLADVSLEGSVDAQAALDWSAERQTLTAELTGQRLRLPDQAADLPAGTLQASAAWDGEWFDLNGEVREITAQPARFNARVPLAARTPIPAVELVGNRPLTAELNWDGALAPLLALAPIGEHRLDGKLSVALKAGGTADDPDLAGDVVLSNGDYEHLLWGTLVRDLQVTASGRSDGRLVIEGAANDGGDGRIALSGEADLAAEGGPTGKLTVELQRATMLRRDDLTAELSADIAAEGTAKEVKLAGTTTVNSMEVIIPERLPASAQELKVREINRGPEAEPEEPEKPEKQGPTTVLDLKVLVPGRAFVRGRGLESEWAGELHITGTSRQPRINGTLSIQKGTLTFAGRDFDIETGTLTFTGGEDPTPDINVLIRHSRDGFSADIRLAGPATAPSLQLSSSPALPDDEILARVIFGKSVRQLSAIQALQLTQSIAQLSGVVGGGPGILDKARRAIGADVLNIEGGENGPQVGVGKYLLDNVYVGVRQGASAGSSGVEAKVEVTPNIILQTDIGQNAESNIGINWKYDY
jgi:translocation and assembly module TamB